MNETHVSSMKEVVDTIKELTDYKRPVCYRLSEIMVLRGGKGWIILYQQNPR